MSFLDQLRAATPEVKTTVETPPTPTGPSLTPTDPLPLWPFAVHSRILGETIWICPDSWGEPVSGPAYSHAEVAALARLRPTPEGLRAIHAVKVGMDGEVLP